MAIERLIDKDEQLEVEVERSLRPTDFSQYIGQQTLKDNLQLAIAAARKRGDCLDHALFYGPAGLGKTTLAIVIANEMQAPLRSTTGPALTTPATLASLLTGLEAGDVLFIDEVHRLNRLVEEVLYGVMEDFRLDISLGKGAGARSLSLDLPRFTLIAATTRAGALGAPFRDRFGHIYRFEFYTSAEISQIIQRSAQILETKITTKAANILATRVRLTPRIANRLLRRVRDYADIKADGVIDQEQALAALELLKIDELGLDEADRRLLRLIIDNHDGGPVGLNTLAAVLGEETQTIEDYLEPFLLQAGLLERTPRGRRVTLKARRHLKTS